MTPCEDRSRAHGSVKGEKGRGIWEQRKIRRNQSKTVFCFLRTAACILHLCVCVLAWAYRWRMCWKAEQQEVSIRTVGTVQRHTQFSNVFPITDLRTVNSGRTSVTLLPLSAFWPWLTLFSFFIRQLRENTGRLVRLPARWETGLCYDSKWLFRAVNPHQPHAASKHDCDLARGIVLCGQGYWQLNNEGFSSTSVEGNWTAGSSSRPLVSHPEAFSSNLWLRFPETARSPVPS